MTRCSPLRESIPDIESLTYSRSNASSFFLTSFRFFKAFYRHPFAIMQSFSHVNRDSPCLCLLKRLIFSGASGADLRRGLARSLSFITCFGKGFVSVLGSAESVMRSSSQSDIFQCLDVVSLLHLPFRRENLHFQENGLLLWPFLIWQSLQWSWDFWFLNSYLFLCKRTWKLFRLVYHISKLEMKLSFRQQ